jgi:hypothetical protein
MNADERFDVTLRSALRWEADRAGRRHPPIDEAAARLAARLGPEPSLHRPRVIAFPEWRHGQPARRLPALVVIALLAALLAALAVGSGLVRLPWFEERNAPLVAPQFGLAGPCENRLPDGVAMDVHFARDPARIRVYSDGRIVRITGTGWSAVAGWSIQARATAQRLAPTGVEALLGTLAEAGLTPGCRTNEASRPMRISADTPAGLVVATWGPYEGAYPGYAVMRVMTDDEEAVMAALAERLDDPEDWLPPDAWIDATRQPFTPAEWVVSVSENDSGQQPGDRLGFPNGLELDGSNPAFDDVRLPDGQTFATFRCGVIDAADAAALREQLDTTAAPSDATWDLYSQDLTRIYTVQIDALDGGPACGANSPEPSASPRPEGDLSALDVCAIVPPGVATEVLDAPEARALEGPAQFDVASGGCVFSGATEDVSFARPIAELYVYGRTVDEATARTLVDGYLGGAAEERLGPHPAWVSACWQPAHVCPGTIAGWTDGHLVFVVAAQNVIQQVPLATDEQARSVLRAALDQIAAGD